MLLWPILLLKGLRVIQAVLLPLADVVGPILVHPPEAVEGVPHQTETLGLGKGWEEGGVCMYVCRGVKRVY